MYKTGLPLSLQQRYSLDTKTLARIDASQDVWEAGAVLQEMHPSGKHDQLTRDDLKIIRDIVRAVIHRSIAYFSVGVSSILTLPQTSSSNLTIAPACPNQSPAKTLKLSRYTP